MRPALLALLIAASAAAAPDPFVRAQGPTLIRDGRLFRAIGFSQPDLFTSVLLDGEAGRRKSLEAIRDAARSDVRFLRFWASGFWPRDMKRYFSDRAGYWAAMDDVVRTAREHRVMLLPSIFWQTFLWPDLCDEPRAAIGDPSSKTWAAMRAYAAELVVRYRDDPNVLMWEIGNEYFLSADLNMKLHAKSSGAGARSLGTRRERTQDDSLTSEAIRAFYAGMAAHIRLFDPNHLITGGDSGPRSTSRSLRESFPRNVFRPDSHRDHIASLLNAFPEPLDVLSIHQYGNLAGAFPDDKTAETIGGLSTRSLERLASMVHAARAIRAPLLVGELGQQDPSFPDDRDARYVRAAIDLLEKEGVSLIGLWVWHFPPQPEFTVTGASYPRLTKRVKAFNRRYAKK